MGKRHCFALIALSLLAPVASAQGKLEIKNTRLAHGPLGATRTDTKFLPGDYLFMSFDLDGLTFDKAHEATFETLLEVYEIKGGAEFRIFDKKTENAKVTTNLGGSRIASDFRVTMPIDQKPGKYLARLTVTDKLSMAKQKFDYPFELLPKDFGIIGVNAPAVGFLGQPYTIYFALTEMKLDAARMPNVQVKLRILDETGTKEKSKPIITQFPKDAPKDLPPGVELISKDGLLPLPFPVLMNQPGRYIVELEALDLAANKQSKLRFKLNVFDVYKLINP